MSFRKVVFTSLIMMILAGLVLFSAGCDEGSGTEEEKIIPDDFSDVWFLWGRHYTDYDSVIFRGGIWLLEINNFGLWSWGESDRVYMVGSSDWEQLGTNLANLDLLVEDAIDTSLIDEIFYMRVNYDDFRADLTYSDNGVNTRDIYLRPSLENYSIAGFATTMDRHAIPDVNVGLDILDGDDMVTQTDDYGFFSFEGLGEVEYRLTFSHDSYESQSIPSELTYRSLGDSRIEPIAVILTPVVPGE